MKKIGGAFLVACAVVLILLGLSTGNGARIGGGLWTAARGVIAGGAQAAQRVSFISDAVSNPGQAFIIGALVALALIVFAKVSPTAGIAAGAIAGILAYTPAVLTAVPGAGLTPVTATTNTSASAECQALIRAQARRQELLALSVTAGQRAVRQDLLDQATSRRTAAGC